MTVEEAPNTGPCGTPLSIIIHTFYHCCKDSFNTTWCNLFSSFITPPPLPQHQSTPDEALIWGRNGCVIIFFIVLLNCFSVNKFSWLRVNLMIIRIKKIKISENYLYCSLAQDWVWAVWRNWFWLVVGRPVTLLALIGHLGRKKHCSDLLLLYWNFIFFLVNRAK